MSWLFVFCVFLALLRGVVGSVVPRAETGCLGDFRMIDPTSGGTVTVASTDAGPWVQSFTFSVFDGYTCSGGYELWFAWITINGEAHYSQDTPLSTFYISTGVFTGAQTWSEINSATITPQIVNMEFVLLGSGLPVDSATTISGYASVATPGGNISPGPISTTASDSTLDSSTTSSIISTDLATGVDSIASTTTSLIQASQTSQSSTTTSDSNITDSTAASTSDSGGLSEDGKTAIATAVPLGVLAIIATFLVVCFKKQLESLGERFFKWLRR